MNWLLPIDLGSIIATVAWPCCCYFTVRALASVVKRGIDQDLEELRLKQQHEMVQQLDSEQKGTPAE